MRVECFRARPASRCFARIVCVPVWYALEYADGRVTIEHGPLKASALRLIDICKHLYIASYKRRNTALDLGVVSIPETKYKPSTNFFTRVYVDYTCFRSSIFMITPVRADLKVLRRRTRTILVCEPKSVYYY